MSAHFLREEGAANRRRQVAVKVVLDVPQDERCFADTCECNRIPLAEDGWRQPNA